MAFWGYEDRDPRTERRNALDFQRKGLGQGLLCIGPTKLLGSRRNMVDSKGAKPPPSRIRDTIESRGGLARELHRTPDTSPADTPAPRVLNQGGEGLPQPTWVVGVLMKPLLQSGHSLSRSLGRLQATWNFSQVGEVINLGLHQVIDELQLQINQLHSLLETRYCITNQCT